VLERLSSFELEWQGQKIPVTFSAGWKDYEMGDRPEEMLARADQALYTSKRATKKPLPAPKPKVKLNPSPCQRDFFPTSSLNALQWTVTLLPESCGVSRGSHP